MHASTLSASAHSRFTLNKIRIFRASKAVTGAIFLACVLAGCGGGGSSAAPTPSVPSAPAPPANPVSVVPSIQPGNWVVMGSSTAAGTGATAGKGWVALLQAERVKNGDVLVNIAKGGASTYDAMSSGSAPVLNRPLPDPAVNIDQALTRKPVLLIVAFPTNDTDSGFSVDETVGNLLAIRARALAASVPVLIVSTQPRALSTSKLSLLRDIDERMAKEVGACFVAVREKLAGPDDKLAAAYNSGDGAHPNDLGHAVIANAVSTVLHSDTCVRISPSAK